jgi:Endonuclease/Exonuclease/phosphatase family 2
MIGLVCAPAKPLTGENEMQKREAEYCSSRELKIVVCTWNAGASKPSDLSRGQTDGEFITSVVNSIEEPDIVVFGFQELIDLENKKMTASTFLRVPSNAESLLKGKSRSKALPVIQEHMSHQYRVWQDKIVAAIRMANITQDDYTLLHSATLVGLFTCILVRPKERLNIHNLSATQVWTGLGGLHGNKGALIVRFTIDDSSLCFVNCHLAAGQNHITQRNNDIANILESASLPPELNNAIRHDYFVGGGDGSMVLDHEICIFNGDMNYRIDLPRETVLSCVRRNEFDKLLSHDQLLAQRRKNPGFRLRSFHEPRITFAPTYKYNVGTKDYDTSEKKRTPAWCDRIYYRGTPEKISAINYLRHEVYASDHRPVSAAFLANVKMVDPGRKQKVWDETAKLWLSVAYKAIENAKYGRLLEN